MTALDWIGARSVVDGRPVLVPRAAVCIRRSRAAGVWLDLVAVPDRFDIQWFVAQLWREDSAYTAGAGAHCDPAVMRSRAVTEAAQSRQKQGRVLV